MMGVYFHIPFCRHACHYCDFHFSTKLDAQEELVVAMLKEMDLRKEELIQHEINTIYFGGGTPSVLSEMQLGRLLDKLGSALSNALEITLEANPEDLNSDYLHMLQRIGINRLSIGVQSFFNEHLEYMNRKHSGAQAEAAIKRAQDAGLTNITADLIFGIPISSFSQWQSNVEQLLKLEIPHFSAYALTVEEKTVFGARQKKGILEPQKDEEVEKSFLYLDTTAKLLGYEHYELSNYALPGCRSLHNGNYWKGVPYVGIGPSAHSFSEGKRRWNVANNPQYIRSIELNKPVFEEEFLNEGDQLNERIMVGLRTFEGIEWKDFPDEWRKENEKNFFQFTEGGNAMMDEKGFRLTPKGWLISDHIISTLFL